MLSVAEEAMRSLCYMIGVDNLPKHVSVEQLEKLLLYVSLCSCRILCLANMMCDVLFDRPVLVYTSELYLYHITF